MHKSKTRTQIKTRQRRRIQCRKGTQRRTTSKKSRRGGIANVNDNVNASAWCDLNGCMK